MSNVFSTKLAESLGDPTAAEMREFLVKEFGRELDRFDMEEAIYWFAYEWHGGGGSNLYRAMSTSKYNPGPVADGPEPDSMAEMAFQALVDEYGG